MTEVHVAICKLIYAYFTTEIILKQLFTCLSTYRWIFTSTSSRWKFTDDHLDIGK